MPQHKRVATAGKNDTVSSEHSYLGKGKTAADEPTIVNQSGQMCQLCGVEYLQGARLNLNICRSVAYEVSWVCMFVDCSTMPGGTRTDGARGRMFKYTTAYADGDLLLDIDTVPFLRRWYSTELDHQ